MQRLVRIIIFSISFLQIEAEKVVFRCVHVVVCFFLPLLRLALKGRRYQTISVTPAEGRTELFPETIKIKSGCQCKFYQGAVKLGRIKKAPFSPRYFIDHLLLKRI